MWCARPRAQVTVTASSAVSMSVSIVVPSGDITDTGIVVATDQRVPLLSSVRLLRASVGNATNYFTFAWSCVGIPVRPPHALRALSPPPKIIGDAHAPCAATPDPRRPHWAECYTIPTVPQRR